MKINNKKEKAEKIPCAKCLGKGGWWASLSSHREDVEEYFTCRDCAGRGELKCELN